MKFLGVAFLVLLAHLAYVDAINGDATWYYQGGGFAACGQQYSDNDYIAALAFSWFIDDGNPNDDPICDRPVRVTDPATGRSVIVRIKDKCAGCKWGDIDLSVAAFRSLRELDVGRFPVRWDFI